VTDKVDEKQTTNLDIQLQLMSVDKSHIRKNCVNDCSSTIRMRKRITWDGSNNHEHEKHSSEQTNTKRRPRALLHTMTNLTQTIPFTSQVMKRFW